jgi:hypothetical protein
MTIAIVVSVPELVKHQSRIDELGSLYVEDKLLRKVEGVEFYEHRDSFHDNVEFHEMVNS